MDKKDPIVVFDSGMGGVSVLREMTVQMPNEDFIYYGDSKNAPYGTKSIKKVQELTLGHIADFVENYHAKGLAIACNTATSAAVKLLRKKYPEIPLVGVEPAIKPAVYATEDPKVLVMATPITINGAKFHKLVAKLDDNATVYPLACPGLMDFVEKGILDGPELRGFLHKLMDPYLEKSITGIVLGCTHYPFLRKPISEIAGPEVEIFDGGEGTARELRRRIHVADLDNSSDHKGSVTFMNSSDDPSKLELSKKLYAAKL